MIYSSTFDKLAGLYWYCKDSCPGVWSWRYRVLSKINYTPGTFMKSIADESDEAIEYYNKLANKFNRKLLNIDN